MRETVTTFERTPKTSAASADTRQRLIESAARMFADLGFEHVTVRELCAEARANVAAVNYHFGDKAGLYRAVIEYAIQVMKETNELVLRAGEGLSPDAQIRSYVRVFVGRLTSDGPNAWIHRLMAREMEHPTEALGLVMRDVMQPRVDYLCSVVSALMGVPASDPRVTRCIASLQGQCLLAARRVPPQMQKVWSPVAGDLEALVNHIAEFSLGGMRAIAARS